MDAHPPTPAILVPVSSAPKERSRSKTSKLKTSVKKKVPKIKRLFFK
jgi:hypothetical protein